WNLSETLHKHCVLAVAWKLQYTIYRIHTQPVYIQPFRTSVPSSAGPSSLQYLKIIMQKHCVATCVLLLTVLLLAELTTATYRKPPFNGSIFGKRGNVVEYENTGKALSALCEIASEACSAWFPSSDN
ncbi:hypothetical protein L9F63_023889, partial [Diploptera punctata]